MVISESKDYIQAAASPRSSSAHDGQDVAVYARGPMSHLLTGVHEQQIHQLRHDVRGMCWTAQTQVHGRIQTN